MDRIREARRGSMAAVNGSLSRRRQRSSGLRDSPEEDGAMEMQETSRLRDRGGKKDRDRDRSGRNKRRRGDRMLHGNHREEGEDSSEESVDEDDEDDEEDSSVAVRLQPSPAQNPAPAASLMQSHNIRKGYPVKPVRPPGTCTWKVAEEMIGAPIPRKARSSSVKRSQECSVSGGGGGGCGGGGEQISCQPSMSPVRRSPSSTAPVSPSSSNASIRKKMKPISVPKPRPPKTSKSSSIQEIEIEVAEVLFGMTRQIPSKQEDHRNDPKESNGSGNEVKSRVSSPNPISPPATSQPSTVRPSNPSINSFPLTATAPKRKRPRVRIEDESPTSPPSSSALPATSCSSVAKLDTEVVLQPVGTKTDPASPRSEKNASPTVENGGFSSDQTVSNVSSAIVFAAKVQLDYVKAESIQDLKDADNQPEKKAKEEAFSPPKATPAANLDVNIEEALASKASMISDTQRDEKFSIDLMAPPGKSSPEIESNSDYVAECKPMEMENAPKPEVAAKAEGEKTEKKSKSEAEEIAHDDKNGGKPSADDSDSRKPAGKERNLDLQLDLEKLDKDVTGAIKHQGQKQQSKAPRTEPKTEKAGPTASLPMPMQITGWPGGFPPFGFMGQVPPLPPVLPVDGTSNSSKLSFLPSQLRPKRCAAHCYIAQNIHYHQQITRLNPFWPSSAGAAPLFASKQYNLNTAPPPPDSAILGSPLQGNIPGKSLGSVQEKGLPASAAHSVFSAKDKNNAATQFMDVSQRKPPALPQSSQPGSSGNMLAPAFIFPLNQQQAAAAGAAAAAAAASRSGGAKLTPGSGNTAQSSSSAGYAALGASGANGSGTSMSFNYPGLAPNEAQYLAFLQNNAYSFPIPAHVGGAQPYRGASPAQAMPFFNLSFYPSQMLHPSQIRLQQQPPSSQQPPYSQQGHQNPSTSSGSSSSQKNTQQSQRVAATAGTAITAGNSHGFPPSKHQHLSHAHQVRQLEPESGGEDAPSTADSRVSQAQKNIYAQKFAMPTHSQNFALIAPAAGALSSGVGNHGEKQQQQQQQQSQNQVMKVDLTPSQAFAMSFASFGGAATGGAAPHGLDFSSMAQNHAIFQSLPETVRHSYQVSAAAAAAAHSTQQQQQQNKKPEDVKSAADLGNTSTVGEEGKISTASKVLGNAQQHSLTFSRADADSPISSILTNNVIDSSSRTLNLIQPPPSVAPRVSSRPASAAPASNSVSNSSNSQHLLSQQHQQQVLQLPKQVQQIQQQQQLILQQHRAKSSVSSHSSASLYTTDRLPGNNTASKFSPGLAGFPPALIQTSASSQPTQWKASTRAANPSSAVAALAAAASSASTSVKNQIPLQQQVRSQQPPAHQTQQISFGPAKVAGQSTQHLAAAGNNAAAAASLPSAATIAVGSPQNSVSKSSSGSPHSSAITKSVPPPPPVLPVLPFQKQQSGKNSSPNSISPLPATNRNMPSILGNPHISSPQNIGSKPQQPSQHLQQSQMPKQHSPQAQTAQLFFSYPYMQSQTSQSDAAAVAAGYFQQHHRRPSDSQRQNSTSASTGMLSLGPPSSLSLAAAPDPSKGGAGATATSNNSKNLMATSLLQHPAQFATISQPGSGANATASAATGHPLMYIHAMQSVPLKPDVSSSAEQKPAAGR